MGVGRPTLGAQKTPEETSNVTVKAGPLGDWTPEQIEAAGREVLALIRDHFAGIDETPVTTDISARELQALLAAPLPEEPEDFETILADTKTRVLPHLTHWNHPRFYAYFAITGSAPGFLADTLASALNVNAMLWKTAPAASALEQVVLRWMAEMIGYDPDADGVLVNGASLATFYALAAAREAAGLGIRQHGMTGRDLPVLRVYCSEHAHSSVDKAVIALGFGLDNLVKLPGDEHHRLTPERLAAAVEVDKAKGYRPLAVVAVAGTTSTGALDPIDAIGQVCRKYGLWLHVDAAYGGFYNIVPSVREKAGTFHAADSIVANPHKGLFTPQEVTALYCRRKGALADAFSLVPPYLRTAPDDGAVNYMDFSLQLGRRFRSLTLWWVIRAFGRQGLIARMEHQLRLADGLRARIDAHPDLETVTRSLYPLVCLRAFPHEWRAVWETAGEEERARIKTAADRFNAALLERVNATRTHFISHSVVPEGYILRVSIGNIRTTQRHVDELWQALTAALASLPRDLSHWLAA